MSAVDTPAVVRTPATWRRRAIGLRLLRSELWLIFGRRRNLAGLGVLAAVPIIIAVAMRIANPSPQETGGPDFFSSITSNGFFVALAALTVSLPMMLPIAVAAISADTIAGEANLGTLRYLLTVPVARTRLLSVKYVAVAIFTFAATFWVAAVGLLFGLVLFGGGAVTLLSGTQVGLGEALLRLAGVSAYVALALCALGAIGLFVSTLTEQPIGATIATVILCVASFVFDSIPQLSWLHPYLLTHWWHTYGDLLRDPVTLDGIQSGLMSSAGYVVIFTTAAWARFSSRDVTG